MDSLEKRPIVRGREEFAKSAELFEALHSYDNSKSLKIRLAHVQIFNGRLHRLTLTGSFLFCSFKGFEGFQKLVDLFYKNYASHRVCSIV